MFKNISWHSFIIFIVIAVIVYYIIIGFLYFRNDLVRLVKEKFQKKEAPEPFSIDSPKKDPALFTSMHELMAALKDLFATAARNGYPKEELLTALGTTLNAYTNLQNTNLEKAITDHIIQTASSMCLITLDESDLKRIW